MKDYFEEIPTSDMQLAETGKEVTKNINIRFIGDEKVINWAD